MKVHKVKKKKKYNNRSFLLHLSEHKRSLMSHVLEHFPGNLQFNDCDGAGALPASVVSDKSLELWYSKVWLRE